MKDRKKNQPLKRYCKINMRLQPYSLFNHNKNRYQSLALPSPIDNDDDFIEVETPYEVDAYFPIQLNKILLTYFSNRHVFLQNILNAEHHALINIFKNAQSEEKIAVFNVTKDREENDFGNIGTTLKPIQLALELYKKAQLSCDKLIIPIAEIIRRHYRLLVINFNHNRAYFYDSKSTLVTNASEIGASFVSAKVDVEKQKSDKMHFGNIPYAINQFSNNYWYLSALCEKYFPAIIFSEISLGHQDLLNHTDCGPFVAEYVKREIEQLGLNKETKIDIGCMRAWQYELLQQKEMNTSPSCYISKK